MFFKKKCKIRKLVKIYTEVLGEDIKQSQTRIHELEHNPPENLPDKIKDLELSFLNGGMQSKIQVLNQLKAMLRNENLMDDWKAGTAAGDVNLRL